MKKYTKEEFLKAAEIGEVSMIEAKHIISLLEEAKKVIKSGFDCNRCIHSFMNPFDQYYCQKASNNGKPYDIENGLNCGGEFYETDQWYQKYKKK